MRERWGGKAPVQLEDGRWVPWNDPRALSRLPPSPDAHEPELPAEAFAAWRLWETLTLSRPVGMAPGAIPLAEVEAWFRIAAVAPRPEVVRQVRIIDEEYLAVEAERARRRRENPHGGPSRPPAPPARGGLTVHRRRR